MTQTEDRIRELIVLSITPGDLHNPWSDAPRRLADTIAAEIDALTADNAQANQWLVNGVAKIERLEKERDEARAEVERLRPAAEAWEKAEVANAANANRMSLIMDAAAYRSAKVAWVAAQEQADAAAARARAAKESQP